MSGARQGPNSSCLGLGPRTTCFLHPLRKSSNVRRIHSVPVARPTCALSGSTEYSMGAGGSGGGEGVAVVASVWAWRAGGGGCSGMAAPLVSWMDGSGPALLVWKYAREWGRSALLGDSHRRACTGAFHGYLCGSTRSLVLRATSTFVVYPMRESTDSCFRAAWWPGSAGSARTYGTARTYHECRQYRTTHRPRTK